MTPARLAVATARASHWLFRRAFPLYAILYDAYKRVGERGDIAVVRQFVRAGDVAVDVGANVGFYTRILARCVGPSGRVYAFEPAPENFARLDRRTRHLRQVRPVHAAVAAQSAPVELYLAANLNVDHRTYASDEPRARVTVDGVALDDVVRDEPRPVGFIKMDIQGAEHAALLGMRDTLGRSPDVKILMELWPAVHDRFGQGTVALLEVLNGWGFVVRPVDRQGSLGAPLTPATVRAGGDDPNFYYSVLCVRATGCDAQRP